MSGEMLVDFLAGVLAPDFGGSREKRAVRRLAKDVAAGKDAVVPGLWLRPTMLGGFLRLRPPGVWWRPGETSGFGERVVCGTVDRVLVRLPHAREIKQGVPRHHVVLVLTTGESRARVAVPKYLGRPVTELLRSRSIPPGR